MVLGEPTESFVFCLFYNTWLFTEVAIKIYFYFNSNEILCGVISRAELSIPKTWTTGFMFTKASK